MRPPQIHVFLGHALMGLSMAAIPFHIIARAPPPLRAGVHLGDGGVEITGHLWPPIADGLLDSIKTVVSLLAVLYVAEWTELNVLDFLQHHAIEARHSRLEIPAAYWSDCIDEQSNS